jgi:hypothetical protein
MRSRKRRSNLRENIYIKITRVFLKSMRYVS